MWQKARILPAGGERSGHPETIGRTLWVIIKPPELVDTISEGGSITFGSLRLSSNVVRDNCHGLILPVQIAPDLVELLPEFADDVPLVSWEEFLKGVAA